MGACHHGKRIARPPEILLSRLDGNRLNLLELDLRQRDEREPITWLRLTDTLIRFSTIVMLIFIFHSILILLVKEGTIA